MNVLVDTSVWSLALRRTPPDLNPNERRLVQEWTALIRDGRAYLLGIIRQEILSGVREAKEFERLRERLAAFDDVRIETRDHEEAARLFNRCHARGVTGSPIDLLICSVALRYGFCVFTTDRDFERYGALLGVDLHVPSVRRQRATRSRSRSR